MQLMLGIDASTNPAKAAIVRLTGNRIEVLEQIETPQSTVLGERENTSRQSRPGDATDASNVAPDANLDDTHRSSGASSVEQSSSPVTGFTETQPSDPRPAPTLASLFKSEWHGATLLIPPEGYLSLNLKLPFGDSKTLAKVIAMEVQDVLPLEGDSLLLGHRIVGALGAHDFDVHVGALARTRVAAIVQQCRAQQVEPVVIAPATAALGALLQLFPEKFEGDGALIFFGIHYVALIVSLGGKPRIDRIIPYLQVTEPYRNGATPEPSAGLRVDAGVAFEVNATIAMAEQKYGKTLTHLWVLGVPREEHTLRTLLQREVEIVTLEELLPGVPPGIAFAALAATYAQDIKAPEPIANFRTKEFAYSPQLSEMISGLRLIRPYLLALLFVAVVVPLAVFQLRSYRLERMRAEIHARVQRILKDKPVEIGKELDLLGAQNAKLGQQLADLGSPTGLSPLDAWLEISQDLPTNPGVVVRKLTMRGNKITIEGSAPDYAAGDQIERALKKKRNVYCRMKKETLAASGGKGPGFSFDIWLCE